MTIDTKRLATDAAYWDEVAPEGATHFDRDCGLFCKECGFWNNDSQWRLMPNGHSDWGTSRYIPRPIKPASPEWDGEGLPPIGTVCEKAPHWYKCEIIAEHDGGLVVYDMHSLDYYKVGLGMNFRPLRTKEQRQKDELADLIENHQMENGSFCTPENTAEAIISRYNLESKL